MMSAKEYTGADDVLAKIQTYKDDFRADAKRIHDTIMSIGDDIYPRLWYGMPGYAKTKTGPVVFYFRKDTYITFGKTESAEIKFNESNAPIPVAWYAKDLDETAIEMVENVARSVLL